MFRSRVLTVVTLAGVLAFGAAAASQCSPDYASMNLPTTTTTLPPGTLTSCSVSGSGGGSCQLTAPSSFSFDNVQMTGTGSIAIDDLSVDPSQNIIIVFSGHGPVNSSFSAIPGHVYVLFADQPATMSFG
jgi:hypothetical protein